MARKPPCSLQRPAASAQPVGPQHRQHTPPVVPVGGTAQSARRPSKDGTHYNTSSSVQVFSCRSKGVGCVLALGSIREIGRIARTHVKTALALPESASRHRQAQCARCLLLRRSGKQALPSGCSSGPMQGAAVAAVVPFNCRDAAAGLQVCAASGRALPHRNGPAAVGAKTMPGEQ